MKSDGMETKMGTVGWAYVRQFTLADGLVLTAALDWGRWFIPFVFELNFWCGELFFCVGPLQLRLGTHE